MGGRSAPHSCIRQCLKNTDTVSGLVHLRLLDVERERLLELDRVEWERVDVDRGFTVVRGRTVVFGFTLGAGLVDRGLIVVVRGRMVVLRGLTVGGFTVVDRLQEELLPDRVDERCEMVVERPVEGRTVRDGSGRRITIPSEPDFDRAS